MIQERWFRSRLPGGKFGWICYFDEEIDDYIQKNLAESFASDKTSGSTFASSYKRMFLTWIPFCCSSILLRMVMVNQPMVDFVKTLC
jgi:hypothetical protein